MSRNGTTTSRTLAGGGTCGKITVAQVHGKVYGAGLMLMWCCDLKGLNAHG